MVGNEWFGDLKLFVEHCNGLRYGNKLYFRRNTCKWNRIKSYYDRKHLKYFTPRRDLHVQSIFCYKPQSNKLAFMETFLKCILPLTLLALFAAGCSQSPEAEEEPEASDGRIYFKEQDSEWEVQELALGCWKTLPEGRYLLFPSTTSVRTIGKDTVYFPEQVIWTKNDYGYEWRARLGSFEDALWMISLSAGRDTLHYTSPGYPPLESWDAVRIEAEEFERKRQEVLLNRYLADAACPPEAISGKTWIYDLAGRWKLILDTETGADYSCDEIVFDFQPPHTLAVTSNHPDYPPSVHEYSYEWAVCNWSLESYDIWGVDLFIDGLPVEDNVQEKVMILRYDRTKPAYRVFIRIG